MEILLITCELVIEPSCRSSTPLTGIPRFEPVLIWRSCTEVCLPERDSRGPRRKGDHCPEDDPQPGRLHTLEKIEKKENGTEFAHRPRPPSPTPAAPNSALGDASPHQVPSQRCTRWFHGLVETSEHVARPSEVVPRAGTCQPHPLPIPLLPGQDGWSWIKIQHAPRSHERYHTVSEPCHTENLPLSITRAHSFPTATMPSPQSPPIAASYARIEGKFFPPGPITSLRGGERV